MLEETKYFQICEICLYYQLDGYYTNSTYDTRVPRQQIIESLK